MFLFISLFGFVCCFDLVWVFSLFRFFLSFLSFLGGGVFCFCVWIVFCQSVFGLFLFVLTTRHCSLPQLTPTESSYHHLPSTRELQAMSWTWSDGQVELTNMALVQLHQDPPPTSQDLLPTSQDLPPTSQDPDGWIPFRFRERRRGIAGGRTPLTGRMQ